MRKKLDDTFSRSDTAPPCDRQMTDRQTDILREHSPRHAHASRGKNGNEKATSDIRIGHAALDYDSGTEDASVNITQA